MAKLAGLHAEGVTDLDSYNLGVIAERERIIKLLEARCLWLIHLDRLTEADELRLQIAFIKGEKQ